MIPEKAQQNRHFMHDFRNCILQFDALQRQREDLRRAVNDNLGMAISDARSLVRDIVSYSSNYLKTFVAADNESSLLAARGLLVSAR
jgi:hypothetical protein